MYLTILCHFWSAILEIGQKKRGGHCSSLRHGGGGDFSEIFESGGFNAHPPSAGLFGVNYHVGVVDALRRGIENTMMQMIHYLHDTTNFIQWRNRCDLAILI